MNEGINLLESSKKASPVVLGKRFQTMRLFVTSLLFIVSVSSVILFILVAISPLPSLQKQEQSLRQNLAQSRNDIVKLALVNERTTSIDKFLQTRQNLDQTLALVQSKLPNGASITTLQGDNQSMTITVESNSLKDLDGFLNGLISLVQTKNGFSHVTLVDLTNDAITNEYAVTIKLLLL